MILRLYWYFELLFMFDDRYQSSASTLGHSELDAEQHAMQQIAEDGDQLSRSAH